MHISIVLFHNSFKMIMYLVPCFLFRKNNNFKCPAYKFVYQMITLGGDAELELVDSLDPFSEGIVFR